jgi:hypothetical protein
MSVHNHPLEWAKEMDRLMGNGTINKDNYLTDCANAVVYVRETAERIAAMMEQLRKAEAKLAVAVKALQIVKLNCYLFEFRGVINNAIDKIDAIESGT